MNKKLSILLFALASACFAQNRDTEFNKLADRFFDEFVFRFNRRRTHHAAICSLLGIAAGHAPLTYNMLISPEATQSNEGLRLSSQTLST